MRLRDKTNYSWDDLNNTVKSYSDFYNVGCTISGKRGYKGKRGLIKLVHYQIGVRVAFIAWKLGISANFFTF